MKQTEDEVIKQYEIYECEKKIASNGSSWFDSRSDISPSEGSCLVTHDGILQKFGAKAFSLRIS